MIEIAEFDRLFCALTGAASPFPWQRRLWGHFARAEFEACQTCSLPTGLGKTSIIPIWLLALAANPTQVPRRLVYVVNRRTVVDQASDEVKRIRERLISGADLPPLNGSTSGVRIQGGRTLGRAIDATWTARAGGSDHPQAA